MISLVEEQYQAALAQRQQWGREDRLALQVPNALPVQDGGRRCDECHAWSRRPAGERCAYRWVDGCVGLLR